MMKIRTGLSIIFRICITALFFVGLVWLIRRESSFKAFAGVVLMLVSVPLSHEVGAVIAGHHRMTLKSFKEISRSAFPVVGPVVLVFVFLSILDFYSRSGDARVFLLMLVVLVPLFRVLIDAMAGDVPWEPVAMSEAYSSTALQMLARLVYVAGGLLLLAFGVLAVVSLFLTVGDLLRQALFSPDIYSSPVLCQFSAFSGEHCVEGLVTWHLVSLIMLALAWRYGHQLLHKIDSLFVSL